MNKINKINLQKRKPPPPNIRAWSTRYHLTYCPQGAESISKPVTEATVMR